MAETLSDELTRCRRQGGEGVVRYLRRSWSDDSERLASTKVREEEETTARLAGG